MLQSKYKTKEDKQMQEKKTDKFTSSAEQVGKAKLSRSGKKSRAELNKILKGAKKK